MRHFSQYVKPLFKESWTFWRKFKYEENYKNKENITCDITNIVLVLVRSMAQFSRFCSTDTALVVAVFVLLEEQRLHLGPGLVVGPRVCCDGDLRGVGLPNRKILWKTSYYNMFSKFKHAITKVSRSVTASCYILYAFTKWTVNLVPNEGKCHHRRGHFCVSRGPFGMTSEGLYSPVFQLLLCLKARYKAGARPSSNLL